MDMSSDEGSKPLIVVKRSIRSLRLDLAAIPVVLLGGAFYLLRNANWNEPEVQHLLIIGTAVITTLGGSFLCWQQMQNPPTLFEVHPTGIRNTAGQFIPWEDIEYIDSNPILGSMTFHLKRRINLTLTPVEAGREQTAAAIEIVRRTAPKQLTREL